MSDDFFWAKHQLIFRHHGDYNVKNLENEYQEWKNLDKKVKEDSFTHENFLLFMNGLGHILISGRKMFMGIGSSGRQHT